MRRSGRNRQNVLSVGLLRLLLMCAFCLVAAAPHRKREAAAAKSNHETIQNERDGKAESPAIKKEVAQQGKISTDAAKGMAGAEKTAQNETETKSSSNTDDKPHPRVIVDEKNLKEITVSKSDKESGNDVKPEQPAANDSSSKSNNNSDTSKTDISNSKIESNGSNTESDVAKNVSVSAKKVSEPSKSENGSNSVNGKIMDHDAVVTKNDDTPVAQKSELMEKAVITVQTSDGVGDGGDTPDAREVNVLVDKSNNNASNDSVVKTETDLKTAIEKTPSKSDDAENADGSSRDSEESGHDEQNGDSDKLVKETISNEQVVAADKNTSKDLQDEKSAKVVVVSEEDLKKNPAFDVNKLFPTKPPPASSDKKDTELLEKDSVVVVDDKAGKDKVNTTKDGRNSTDKTQKEEVVKPINSEKTDKTINFDISKDATKTDGAKAESKAEVESGAAEKSLAKEQSDADGKSTASEQAKAEGKPEVAERLKAEEESKAEKESKAEGESKAAETSKTQEESFASKELESEGESKTVEKSIIKEQTDASEESKAATEPEAAEKSIAKEESKAAGES
ncbi:hypothetical protein ACHWQZ_G012041 [Mnemiopsis leidyi]